MLVLTRRPGQSILIGDNIEVFIVEVDCDDFEARYAISEIDADGNDLPLRSTISRGITVVTRAR